MNSSEIGKIGEDIAVRHIVSMGYRVIARNLHYDGGEIDIVAERGGTVHLLEVKCVTREKVSIPAQGDISREMFFAASNYTSVKHRSYERYAQLFLNGRDFKIELIGVLLDLHAKTAFVEIFDASL